MGERDSIRETLKRVADMGASLSGVHREDLEDLFHDVILGENGQRRERAEDFVDDLRARSKRSADHLAAFVRAEIRRELEARTAKRWNELGDLFERGINLVGDLLEQRATPRTRQSPADHEHAAPPSAPVEARATATKKAAPAKKAPVKKAPAKKAPAKKASSAATAPAAKKAGSTTKAGSSRTTGAGAQPAASSSTTRRSRSGRDATARDAASDADD